MVIAGTENTIGRPPTLAECDYCIFHVDESSTLGWRCEKHLGMKKQQWSVPTIRKKDAVADKYRPSVRTRQRTI
jgi:hypothetical protein